MEIDIPKATGPGGQDIGSAKWKINGRFVMSTQVQDNNDLTISILRKGKKAISLGKAANPTLSRFLTRSSDIQIDSVRQAAKLGRDVTKAKNE